MKLSSIGMTGNLLSWFKSYLADIKQRVVHLIASSEWSNVTAGVPQGSILGPLLFLIYIIDIVQTINSKIRLFADDTSLYIIVDDPSESATQLNADINTVHQWSQNWLVTFNPSKTESMIFSRKQNKPHHPDLYMNNTVINTVTEHKHLGLTFSDDGKWKAHISSSLEKAWQRIGMLRSLKFTLTRSSIERLYITSIRPLLEYGNIVWDNCTNYLKNDLDAIQTEAARIVTGATKLCSIANLYRDLKWETLSLRRKNNKLVQLYKMKNGLTPTYLTTLIPTETQQRYALRNVNNIPSLCGRTQQYTNSFLPSTIRDWNSLPESTRYAPTISSFKYRLNKDTSKSSPLFNVGTRKDQILHARLRMSCSSLNYDLYRKSIIDSPLCTCGAPETVSHFLISCRQYQHQRQLYLTDIRYRQLKIFWTKRTLDFRSK